MTPAVLPDRQEIGRRFVRSAREALLDERLALVVAVALSRLAFRTHRLYDVDSVNFALAIDRFDPALHQPHPPGYYLYVLAGRALSSIFADANDALVAVSILASCGAVVAVYQLAQALYGGRAGLHAGVVFALSPLAWFHGGVALTYIVELFFSALIGWLCWRTYSGPTSHAVLSALLLAASVGFRQSSILFLGPLWLLSVTHVSWRERIRGSVAFVVGCCAWFIPMSLEAGGVDAYFGALSTLWSLQAGSNTIVDFAVVDAVATAMARFLTILFILLLTTGGFALASFAAPAPPPDSRRQLFFAAWLVPGFLFFSLVYLIFVNSGYLLVITPPVIALVGAAIDRLTAAHAPRRAAAFVGLGIAGALNVAVFFHAPLYFSYDRVRAFESRLDRVTRALRAEFSPHDTFIVGFDAHFMGWRHAGYYLPEFLVTAAPRTRFGDQRGIFAARERRTLRLDDPPSDGRRAVFFPLLEGREGDRYFVRAVRDLLPVDAISRVAVGGIDFATAPAAAVGPVFDREPD